LSIDQIDNLCEYMCLSKVVYTIYYKFSKVSSVIFEYITGAFTVRAELKY